MQYHSAHQWRLLFLLVLISMTQPIWAQRSAVYTEPEAKYKSALDLFDKEKFGAAREAFDEIVSGGDKFPAEIRVNAQYYQAVSAMQLYHKDTESLLVNFAQKHPESHKYNMTCFQLGRLYFREKKSKNAVDWLEKVDTHYLSALEREEYFFKIGYSYFNREEYENAQKSFREVKDGQSKYAAPSRYYYAHIAYINKNHETALQEFQVLKNHEVFGTVVPYYIVQIYFLQGKYDEVITYGSQLTQTADLQNKTEVDRMIGESYYRTARYTQAIPYLESYQANSALLMREDHYQLGYCYYITGACEKAVFNLEKAANGTDEIAQNALYHLGGCFIKVNDKSSARNAFQSAHKMEFDKGIQEDALFNFAKLSFELSYQPVAISSLRDFIKSYPNSDKIDEANELLAQVFLTTKNYKDALVAIESIKLRSERVKSAYQKIAYYRGLELYNDGDSKGSIVLFDKAIANPIDGAVLAAAKYWKAEALYKLNDFETAIRVYQDFQYTPAAINMPIYNLANYNIGYAYFKKGDYENANTAFRRFTRNKSEVDADRHNDALIRIADGYFVQHEYGDAVEYYNNAISGKAKASDYAMYQKGIIQGIQNNLSGKVATLQQLTKTYSSSQYIDDAIYETANAYFLMRDNASALANFSKVISDYPNSSYVRKALLGRALVYYNMKEDEKALQSYKQVVEKYPSTPESAEALAGIRVLYVNAGTPDTYIQYVQSIPSGPSISVAVQDSITYQAAEIKYLKGDCTGASKDLSAYLDKFPNGFFAVNANFYKSECALKSGQTESAIKGYTYVINQPRNNFTEKSLLKLGNLSARNKDCAQTVQYMLQLESIAEVSANQVEARAAIMRCHFQTGDYANATAYAEKLKSMDKVPNEILNEAILIHGKSAMAKDDFVTALREFGKLSRVANSEIGAEAKFNVASIQYKQQKYKESQATVFEIINQVPSYDLWIARGFILLADNYVALGDTFQAKHTYQSIIDNFEGEELKQVAQQKLDALSKPASNRVIQQGKENEALEIELK